MNTCIFRSFGVRVAILILACSAIFSSGALAAIASDLHRDVRDKAVANVQAQLTILGNPEFKGSQKAQALQAISDILNNEGDLRIGNREKGTFFPELITYYQTTVASFANNEAKAVAFTNEFSRRFNRHGFGARHIHEAALMIMASNGIHNRAGKHLLGYQESHTGGIVDLHTTREVVAWSAKVTDALKKFLARVTHVTVDTGTDIAVRTAAGTCKTTVQIAGDLKNGVHTAYTQATSEDNLEGGTRAVKAFITALREAPGKMKAEAARLRDTVSGAWGGGSSQARSTVQLEGTAFQPEQRQSIRTGRGGDDGYGSNSTVGGEDDDPVDLAALLGTN